MLTVLVAIWRRLARSYVDAPRPVRGDTALRGLLHRRGPVARVVETVGGVVDVDARRFAETVGASYQHSSGQSSCALPETDVPIALEAFGCCRARAVGEGLAAEMPAFGYNATELQALDCADDGRPCDDQRCSDGTPRASEEEEEEAESAETASSVVVLW